MTKLSKASGHFIYTLTSTIIKSEDFDSTIVYGISIHGKESRAIIEDISDDYDSVLSLFDFIVEEELYPEHLTDVVEDFLTEKSERILQISLAHTESPSIAYISALYLS